MVRRKLRDITKGCRVSNEISEMDLNKQEKIER